MKAQHVNSSLEERFARLWDAAGGPELVREYRFEPKRRWRADFAWPDAKMLIEIEGGVWNRGRHLTPRGFMNDAEKYPAATLQGWAVIRLVDTMLTPDTIKQILDYARNRISGRPVA
ncbi:MAG: hypothetical protein Q4A24_00015 [Akkermansia sp.]|nr:hypothetical protein [Akkermansia sp.]